MNPIWGVIMAVVGLFMLVSGITRSNFIVYRLLVARSKMFWGENVHRFYQAVGTVLIVLGVLAALGVVW
ncbi:MAG: hypothetical protein J7K48_08515 [Thermococcus sp.]|uniref:Uncharacterized protein n=1 Tax=Thermococcus guaymasensis DSM 11113 TaxID=1432656 RepID=A0A0X1KN85_9EURY|nr:hypothetical protein [Thermococcus guaymasensis]AJC72719.1 hypothetical protein X802_05390 [Thermococcus guaymasensis DSM 11113]MCD6525013.1 hypothetical protein [Thermococcus sp.]